MEGHENQGEIGLRKGGKVSMGLSSRFGKILSIFVAFSVVV